MPEPESHQLPLTSVMTTDDTTQSPGIGAARAVTLPCFWSKNPALWLAQVEAKFALSRITSPTTKYFHLLESLARQVATEVQEFISTPVTATSFEALKSALITRLAPSESTCLQRFLATEGIGDRTPSQYLHYLQRLLGPKGVTPDEALLKEVFLQRLPSKMRFALAAWHDSSNAKIATIANRLMLTCHPASILHHHDL